ncbi:DUF3325 family protein [Croceibacterium sp. TMG7-5b_MA50]|uniref:DUF3325 family protein n=1 Tax=Croceibacterium sp. TMG7-5b_MA50 TaxID=3121290 RepID=UPI003221CAC1
MSDGLLLLLALLAATGGMAALALAMQAHWRQVMGARRLTGEVQVTLRVLGAALCALSLALCVAADPASMAALVWPMLLMVAALLVAAGLTLHARARS